MDISRTDPIHILLVEDDEDDYRLVRDLLSDLIASGSTLRWVPDYDEALSVLLTGDFDVCLLDYRLADRDGMEFLEEATRSACPTPIIFLTGAGNLELDYMAMKTGAADFLTKDELSALLLDRSMRYAIEIKNKNEQILRTKVIAERKQAEDYRSRLAALVDSSDDAIIGKTLEGIITSWNRGAEKIYGYSESEAIGKPISFLLPPGQEDEVPRLLAKIEQGEPVQHYETVRRRKNGTDIHMSITISPIRNADGSLIGASSIEHDLTERKKVEEALRTSVEEKTSLLNEVHHRVKNNLQIVSSLLGLQAGRARNRHLVDILQDTRNRVKAIALLHETLYRSGNLAAINFPTYVKDLCEQLLHSSGPERGRVKSEYEIAQIGLPLKQALPCGLIVSELVSNALKHGFPNKHSGSISVRLETNGKRTLILSVSDDGVGLPTNFDPSATSTLGIQLVSKLAGQLGGGMEVERPKDGGACFRVVFPLPAGSLLGEKS